VTLARYLAGEATEAEAERVRLAMDEHPKVRECVAIVREVAEETVTAGAEAGAARNPTIPFLGLARRSLPKRRFLIASLAAASLFMATLGTVIYTIEVVKLNRTVATATDQRNAKMKGATAISLRASGANEPEPEAPDPDMVIRAVVPTASQIGDMVVAVQTVRLGQINQPVQGEYLSVTLRITNVSKKPISYASWSGPDIPVMLRVEQGAFYNRVPLPKQEARSINPNETIRDTLVFEPPPALKHLEMDLPIPGSDRSFHFRIPFSQVERAERKNGRS